MRKCCASQVDLVAPGVGIFSTAPDNAYKLISGTSMASPHAAGVAAAVWARFPGCSGAEIRRALEGSAFDLGAAGRDNAFGWGLVQTQAAINLLTAGGCDATGGSAPDVFAPTPEMPVSVPDVPAPAPHEPVPAPVVLKPVAPKCSLTPDFGKCKRSRECCSANCTRDRRSTTSTTGTCAATAAVLALARGARGGAATDRGPGQPRLRQSALSGSSFQAGDGSGHGKSFYSVLSVERVGRRVRRRAAQRGSFNITSMGGRTMAEVQDGVPSFLEAMRPLG